LAAVRIVVTYTQLKAPGMQHLICNKLYKQSVFTINPSTKLCISTCWICYCTEKKATT